MSFRQTITKKFIQLRLDELCKITKEPQNEAVASTLGKNYVVKLVHNTMYGGYAVVAQSIESKSLQTEIFGFPSVMAGIPAKEMYNVLDRLIWYHRYLEDKTNSKIL